MGKFSAKRLSKNFLISIAAQIVSLACSFLLQMIVPKFIPELDYAYWQSFVLYVNYVGVLHFGLLDGIVLRYSQYDYEELDKARIRSQFVSLLIITSFLSALTLLVSGLVLGMPISLIVMFVGIGIVTKNVFTYTSYTFQITNRINKYAILVISQRLFYALLVSLFLFLRLFDFYWFCIAELLGDVVAIILGAILNKGLYFGELIPLKEMFKEIGLNVSSGFLLLIANWTSNLIVGSAKMLIQWQWGELVFGKIAFAFSVSNVFLTFVSAISIVLFPSLKRMDKETLPDLYNKIRGAISPLLFIVLLFSFPGRWLLSVWIPKYSESLVYLTVLLPIVVFSSKVSLLTNNYLKAYRKEKQMLFANLFSIVFGLGGYFFFALVIKNVELVLMWVVITIMLRSIISEVLVMKIIKKNFVIDFVIEAFMVAAFILASRYLSLWIGMLLYFVFLVIYIGIYHKTIGSLFLKIKDWRR